MLLLSLVHFVPIFGWMFYGLLHALYWLLRDVNGASPGKAILGSFVANAVGGPSTNSQRILRNLPLAIPGFLGLIRSPASSSNSLPPLSSLAAKHCCFSQPAAVSVTGWREPRSFAGNVSLSAPVSCSR